MKNYKRSAVDREVTFNAPKYTCYACNDTGIYQQFRQVNKQSLARL